MGGTGDRFHRNYDYRYGWIRDTSFVLDALIQLGLTQEVQGTLAWMLLDQQALLVGA